MTEWADEENADISDCDLESAKSKVERDMHLGSEFGVTGTPTVLVEDEFVVGAQNYQVFDSLLSLQ